MKNLRIKKTVWQSLLSVMIFGVFVYFALSSSIKPEQVKIQKEQLENGDWINTVNHKDGRQEVTTGKMDENNNWHGTINIEYLDAEGNKSFEEVTMEHGVRNGVSKMKDSEGNEEVVCYNMGVRVECNKSANIAGNSAYEILNYKYPWYIFKLNALGFSDEYIKAFMDTFEVVLNSYEFEIEEFDSYYGDINEIFSETQYDSIVVFNSLASYLNGLELSKSVDFRLAILDQHRGADTSVFNVVKTKYPNYLLLLKNYEVSENDFKEFCLVFDSIMISYGSLDINDPYFVDSLDERMFRAIFTIASEENSVAEGETLKSMNLTDVKIDLSRLWKQPCSTINKVLQNSDPTEVSAVVISIILLKYIEGDLVRRSLLESYSFKKEIAILPTVTTGYVGRNSSSSVTLAGNITYDGGADITTRGIAWGTVFNPDVNNTTIPAGEGTGSFEKTVDGLSEGVTYYARAYATNSAGTAYGNCISFTTNSTVGVDEKILNESNIVVFPNPTAGKTTFSFQAKVPGKIKLSIVNINGQTVVQKEQENINIGENHVEVDFSNLENGMYTCRIIESDSKQLTCKFIVNRR